MEKVWYRAVNGQPEGPYTSTEIQNLALAGTLKPDDLVTKHGSQEWYKASQIQNVKFQASPQVVQVQQVQQPQQQVQSQPQTAFPVETAPANDLEADLKRRRRESGNQTKILIAAGVLFFAGIGGTALIMSSLNGKEKGTVVVTPPAGLIAPVDEVEKPPERPPTPVELTKELKEERDALRKEVKTLKESKDELEQERNTLQREIKNFTTRIDFINKSRNADFVMINPALLNVSLKVEEDGLRVLSKAEGESAADTLGACRNWHIPRMRQNPALTRAVYQRTEPGKMVPDDLLKTIKNDFWNSHRYSPYSPELKSSEINLVVFRDLEKFEIQTGYFLGADKSGVDYFPLGMGKQRMKWADIQAGTARRGPVEEVLRNFGNVDFLEYCVLRVAQKVGSGEFDGKMVKNARPSVFVHVDLDIPNDHLKFYKSLDNQLVEQGRPPESFEAEGTLGIMAFFADLAFRSSVPSRRKNLRAEMLKTDPHKRVRHLSRYLEDEVMARLSKCGISPITEQDQALIASLNLKDSLKAASMNDATHLLRVILKPSRASGDYHLSVRLYHEDGREIWTDEGDRDLDTDGVGNQYHLASGRPALVYLKKEHFKSFTGQQSPPVMPRIKTPSVKSRYAHLVYLESDRQSDTILHRTLFQNKIYETPRDHFAEIKFIESMKDIPQDHILPYVTLRIAESVLPIAGRVNQTNGKAAVISLSSNHQLQSGDRLRVIRVNASPESLTDTLNQNDRFTGLFAHGKSLLPTELVVTQAAKDQVSVTISSTGLEELWPENIPLKANDLVLVNTRRTQVLALDKLVLVPPSPKVAISTGINKSMLAKSRLEAETQQTATQVEELIASALTKLHIPVLQTSASSYRSNSTKSRQANIRLHGNITLSSKMNTKARGAAKPVFRLELKVSPTGSNEVIQQFDFDLDDFVMPSR